MNGNDYESFDFTLKRERDLNGGGERFCSCDHIFIMYMKFT